MAKLPNGTTQLLARRPIATTGGTLITMAAHAIKALIGRDRELAAIDQLLEELKEASSAVLYVVGEPGIGKTALLSEALERAEATGFATLSGRATEFERDLP